MPAFATQPIWRGRTIGFLLWLMSCLLIGQGGVAEEKKSTSVTSEIDKAISAAWQAAGVSPTAPCNDSEFVRRIYLDLAGRIPTIQERVEFVDDKRSDKRDRLIDRILASPDYAKHMREVVDVVLMGRAKNERIRNERESSGWWKFLETSFAANRPWPHIAEAIITARPEREEDLGASWFLFERRDKHQAIAESISTALFGMQIQCAQCHDHPSVAEIEQRHYWGLVAFFNRSKNAKGKRSPVGESAVGGFAEFADLTGDSQVAMLTFFRGDDERTVEEPKEITVETKDSPELYVSANGTKRPKFSRREQFATQIVRDNSRVDRALVNRLWALFLGRGFVHPVDRMDSEHAPSHPQLLELLASDFRQSGGDLQRLIRGIVRSQAYQLSVKSNGQGPPRPELFASALEKPLTAEALYRSMRVATLNRNQPADSSLAFAFEQTFPDVFPVEVVANLKQALMLSNHPGVVELTQPRDSNLAARILKAADTRAAVDLAFQSVLGRAPDAVELETCGKFLESGRGKERAAAQLIWALLTGPEFRFNH